MQIHTFIPQVTNYRGFAVAAISEGFETAYYLTASIEAVPFEVSYDQYVGVASIAASHHTNGDKYSQIMSMFKPRRALKNPLRRGIRTLKTY